MNSKTKYYFIALIPPFMGAASYTISKYLINEISPVALLFYRWLVAVAILTPLSIKSFLTELEYIRANLRILTIIAVSGVTLFNLFSYHALQYTTSTNVSIIIGIFPVFVLALGVIIEKDKLKSLEVYSIILSFIGVLIILSRGRVLEELSGLFNNFGDILALVAALCWGLYVFAVKYKPTDLSFRSFVYTTSLIGTILILPIYSVDIFYLENVSVFTLANAAMIFFLGLGVSIIGMTAFSISIVKIGPNISSIIYYLAPVFTTVLATIFLGEELEVFHIVGMVVIIIGINLPFIGHYRNRRSSIR